MIWPRATRSTENRYFGLTPNANGGPVACPRRGYRPIRSGWIREHGACLSDLDPETSSRTSQSLSRSGLFAEEELENQKKWGKKMNKKNRPKMSATALPAGLPRMLECKVTLD